MEWKEIAKKLLLSWEIILENVKEIDCAKATDATLKAFYIQEDTMSDKV